MGTVGRLKEGNLLLTGELKERMPAVTNGLVSYMPLDGPGGAWDIIGGNRSLQNAEKGANLVESMAMNWRKPESWSGSTGISWDEEKQALKITGYRAVWLKTPIVIDPTKRYELMYEVMIEERPTGGLLYLGGLSNNASKVKATQNYDYTMASGNTPPIGVWTTFKLTRTGTAIAYNGQAYSYDTVKGWTGDTTSTSITDRLIKYYHMGGLFNYSTGGTMYIRNMQAVVVSEDTSAVTLLEDAVGVEEATVNLCRNDGQGGQTTFGGDGVPSINKVEDNIRFRGNKVVRFKTGSSGNFYINGSGNITQTAATNFTSSFYIKRIDGKTITNIGTYLYVAGNANDNQNATYIEEVENGWYRVIRVRSGLVSGAVSLLGCYGLGASTEYLIANWQLEGKPYATSYTPSTRGTGKLYFDDLGGYMNYTIVGQMKLDQPFRNSGAYIETPRSGAYLFAIYDRLTTGYIGYRYWEDGTGRSGPYLNRSGTYGATNLHAYYAVDAHKWGYFVIQKSGTQFTFQIYQDGWKAKHTGVVDAGARLDDFRLGDSTMMNVLYKNLAIYNRALSEEEINKAIGNQFSVSKEGNFMGMASEALNVASDISYFPLGNDGFNKGGGMAPSVSTNIVEQEGATWIGNNTVNYAQHPITAFETYFTYERRGAHHFATRHVGSTSSTLALQCPQFTSAITAGTLYTVSGYLYKNGVPFKTTVPHISTYHTGTTRRESRDNGYFEYTQPYNSSGWIFHNNIADAVVGDVLELRNLMIEIKPFASAYTEKTRGDSKLAYAPGVLWDGPWSVGLFAKARPAALSERTRNPLFELGSYYTLNETALCVSSWDTGGRIIQVVAHDNQVWKTTPGAHTLGVDDMDSGVFATLRYDGARLYFDTFSKSGHRTTSAVKSWATPIRDNIFIGGYGWADALNGYIKDFFYANRFVGDEELKAIYGKQMQAKKNKPVIVQGEVREGKVL